MDQELLNSSRYRISAVSVDSRFADNLYKGTADYMIKMPSTYRNIMRIALSSVELPLVEYTFSEEHGNLNFTVTYNATTYPLTIPAGNYTPTELCAQIQTALRTILDSFSEFFTCTYNPNTGRVTIANPDVRATDPLTAPSYFTEINLVSANPMIAARRSHWGLGYYLGFKKGTITATYTGETLQVVSDCVAQTGPSPYYLLQVECPDMIENITHRVDRNASVPALAKLILRDGYYAVQFDDGSNLLRKEYTFLTPVNIAQLRLRLVDPFGQIVDMCGVDWSATFELYEVVNSRTYNAIGHIYDR